MKQIWMIMWILMFLSGLSQTVREKLSEISGDAMKYDEEGKLVNNRKICHLSNSFS